MRRTCAVLLSLSLAMPSSAYALRPVGLEENPDLRKQMSDSLTVDPAGLEEKINLNQPDLDSLKKQLRQRFPKNVLSDGAIKGIINRRRQGPLNQLVELTQIPGIGKGKLSQIQSDLTLGEPPVAAPKALGKSSSALVPPPPTAPAPAASSIFSATVAAAVPAAITAGRHAEAIQPLVSLQQRIAQLKRPPPLLENWRDPTIQEKVQKLLSELIAALLTASEQRSSTANIQPCKLLIQQIDPTFQIGFSDQVTPEQYWDFARRVVEDEFLPRCGQMVFLRSGPNAVLLLDRWILQGSWQSLPYLGLPDVIWMAETKKVVQEPIQFSDGSVIQGEKGTSGLTHDNIAFVDLDHASDMLLQQYRLLVPLGSEDWMVQRLLEVLPPTSESEKLIRTYRGRKMAWLEEQHHTQAVAWGVLRPGRQGNLSDTSEPIAEAVLKPGFIRRRFWIPERNPQRKERLAGSIVELEGELGALSTVLDELVQQGKDHEAYGIFLFYYLGKRLEAGGVTLEAHRSGSEINDADLFFELLKGRRLTRQQILVNQLNRNRRPGFQAAELIRGIYGDTYFSHKERQDLLTPAGMEEVPVAALRRAVRELGRAINVKDLSQELPKFLKLTDQALASLMELPPPYYQRNFESWVVPLVKKRKGLSGSAQNQQDWFRRDGRSSTRKRIDSTARRFIAGREAGYEQRRRAAREFQDQLKELRQHLESLLASPGSAGLEEKIAALAALLRLQEGGLEEGVIRAGEDFPRRMADGKKLSSEL